MTALGSFELPLTTPALPSLHRRQAILASPAVILGLSVGTLAVSLVLAYLGYRSVSRLMAARAGWWHGHGLSQSALVVTGVEIGRRGGLRMADMDRYFPSWTSTELGPELDDEGDLVDAEGVVGGAGSDTECPICLHPFLRLPRRTLSACGHTFHSSCIVRWMTGTEERSSLGSEGGSDSVVEAHCPQLGEGHTGCPVCRLDYSRYALFGH
ncbi:hypothetical protein DFJ74DRAFT_709986 [Hyaloraphidium curvatum]|nr:hypothetical protein DFJ74DRAFT_709986 [Hyaloraphidium curvatum]